jgi:hypothetical protein
MAEPVLKSGLKDYQQHYIDLIIKEGLLRETENGEIIMVNLINPFIAGELHENGCLSYWNYSTAIRSEIDRLLANGTVKTDSKLFSEFETSYLKKRIQKWRGPLKQIPARFQQLQP